jgi:hypothetical protein
MKSKLTLTVEKDLIAEAKIAARAQRTSISSLVENFLSNLCLESEKSFSEKWQGAFKEPPHQRPSILQMSTPQRHITPTAAARANANALSN